MIASSLTEALGWTLFHSLWQATLVALVFLLVRRVVRQSTWVYGCALVAMLIVAGWSLSTLISLYTPNHTAKSTANTQYPPYTSTIETRSDPVGFGEPMSTTQSISSSWLVAMVHWINSHISFVVIGWLLGMAILSARLAGGLWYLSRLRHERSFSLPAYERTVAALASRLRLHRPVGIRASGLASVPMVIGYLKPLILLPASLVSSLPPEQVEAIIAHELAHVRRHDYWVNLFQSLLEVVFFYHPAVWWLSSVVREEREKCCDDIAVSLCGNTLVYAKALSEAESLHRTSAPLVLAFARRRGGLLARIERLVHPPISSAGQTAKVISVVSLLLLVIYSAGGDTLARKVAENEPRFDRSSQATSPLSPDTAKVAEDALTPNDEPDLVPIQGSQFHLDSVPDDSIQKHAYRRFSFRAGDSDTFSFDMNFQHNDDSAHQWQFSVRNDTFPDFTWSDSTWRSSIGALGEAMAVFSEELTAYLEDSVDTKTLRRQLRGLRQELGRVEEEIVSSLQSSDYRKRLEAIQDELQSKSDRLEKKLEQFQQESDTNETLKKLNRLLERQREEAPEQPQRDSIVDRTAEDLDQLLELLQEEERAQAQAHARMHNNFDDTIHRLEKELLADGLVERGKEYRFELKSKGLYINRRKKKPALRDKYRDLLDITENTSFSITRTAE